MEQKKQVRGWDGFLPFYSQWYWQKSAISPYKQTKVWYPGPREKWMKLVKEKKK